MGVDRGVGVTRDFCTAVGKGIAPRADSANSTGGYPKTRLQKGDVLDTVEISVGHRGMTDIDKILPRLDGKVKGKCPIKRTE